MRWLSLTAGLLLVALAFASATRVADTRDGLIAEVITLFAALAGISLILYGIFAGARLRTRSGASSAPRASEPRVRSVRDLLAGGAGIVLALVLLGGLAASAGVQWAGLGSVLLLPMIAGSVYLCARFVRARERDWRVRLRKSDAPKQA